MFTLRKFVKDGLLESVGSLADYQVRLNAAGWLEKGVLLESDLAEIDALIQRVHGDADLTDAKAEAYDVITGRA